MNFPTYVLVHIYVRYVCVCVYICRHMCLVCTGVNGCVITCEAHMSIFTYAWEQNCQVRAYVHLQLYWLNNTKWSFSAVESICTPTLDCCKSSPTLFLKILFIFRETAEGEREGEKHQCEGETSISYLSHTPQPRTKSTTWARALTGNWTSNLSLCRTTSNQLSHTGQGLTNT